MIEYDVFPFLNSGELYTEFEKTDKTNDTNKSKKMKKKTVAITSYYSFDPLDTNFDQNFHQKFDTLLDFLNFLNFDETDLNKEIIDFIHAICEKPQKTHLELFEHAMGSLASVHAFFTCHTDYHLYDLVMRYSIASTSQFQSTEPISKTLKLFQKYQYLIAKHIFIHPLPEQTFFAYYDKLFEKELTSLGRYNYFVIHNPCDEIIAIRDLIIENIPYNKQFDRKEPRWQKFIFEMNRKFDGIYTLSSYALTNHAKYENYKLYKTFLSSLGYLSNSPRRIIRKYLFPQKDAKKKTTDKSENAVNNHLLYPECPDTKSATQLFTLSKKQANDTYPISSFGHFLVAEIYSIFREKLSISQCEYCGNFFISGQDCPPKNKHSSHNKTDIAFAEKINQLYEKKISEINTYWDQNYSGPYSPNNNIDPTLSTRKFDELKKYLNKTRYLAISTKMESSRYEKFISQEQLSLKKLDMAIRRIADINSEESDCYQDEIKIGTYHAEFQFPVFGEIIDPEALQHNIRELEKNMMKIQSYFKSSEEKKQSAPITIASRIYAFLFADYLQVPIQKDENKEDLTLTHPLWHRHLKRKDSIRFLVLLDFSHFFICPG